MKTKFDKAFWMFQKIDTDFYAVAYKYRKRLKYFTMLWLADRVYSDYIKITKSDKDWECTCCTCWSKEKRDNSMMQNGHFHTRKDYKYRFMDLNCYPQCRQCNCAFNWNYVNYTKFMAEKLWSYEKAIEMYNDKEMVDISRGQMMDMVKFRDKIIESLKPYKS